MVFEEIGDAKNAMEHLNGFHLQERYIVGESHNLPLSTSNLLTFASSFVVLYHMPAKMAAKADLAKREADLERLKQQHDIKDEQ